MSGVILTGLGLAALGFGARYALRQMPNAAKTFNEAMKNLPKFEESSASSKYYKGGFDQKMNRREAALILGVGPSANKAKVKEAFKKAMSVNHPDRGGSPYLASKINEAKDYLEKHAR
ncbi:mitochondrial import inner membrane translocase subunit TIM14 [Sitophilus oryzae]|uniref:Mitochondrial import inner membrane translocase subunit TIM14 n=1 Tax=Sitophilus oryzae TaxID=7048 RepID=A0A6J2XAM8_SITOR|nr:mitochondrial import inner membrane translocase subunit TIM14 [Sitophilus oryzae]